jgi:hypothetical protein
MRDLRIDFLRGISLIIIFIDHLTETADSFHGTHFHFPTLRTLGFCSAAEFFVFFSGYVFGIVYIKNLSSFGLWKCQLKALARARYILTANAIMFAIVAGLTLLFPNKPQTYLETSDLWFLYSDFESALTKFALLEYFPAYTDILPLYSVFLVFSPGMLLLLKDRLLVGLALSLALYVSAATIPWLNLPVISAARDQWFLNPLSWQLLFVMGIALGSRGTFARLNVPSKRTVLWIIGFVLGAIGILNSLTVIGKVYQIPYVAGAVAAIPGMDMRTVGVTRLLYFISLLFFLMGIMPSTETLRKMKVARPIIACGQRSLEIFCLSTLLCELGSLVLYQIHGNYLSYIVVITLGTLVMLSTGLILTSTISIRPVLLSDYLRRRAPRARL